MTPDYFRSALGVSTPVALGENTSRTNLTAEELYRVLSAGNATGSGVTVSADAAMRVATVYSCVALIAGAIASLPLGVFERKSNGDRDKASHDYWWLFNEQASDGWTSFAAIEYLITSKLFYGDGFGRLLRPSNYSPRVIGWEPLHPLRVTPFDDPDGVVRYRYQPQRGPQIILDAADVIHLHSLGFDGKTSPSPITYAAREAVGMALAAEQYTAKFFGNGATFDIALKAPGRLSPEQADTLRASFLAKYTGINNMRAPLVLSGGLEVEKLSITPEDAALLPTRVFTVQEICRVFGVPPHMVGHTEKSTSWGTGLEQQGMGFVRYTLQRHLTPLAQELNRKLWPSRQKYFVEHVTSALERGDLKSRSEAYRIALGRAGEPGWMVPNEIRRLENMPGIEGGDELNKGMARDANEQPASATAEGQPED